MHIVTGGAGFIGSAFVWKLNEMGVDNILVVDDLGHGGKWLNLRNRRFADYLHKDRFFERVMAGEDFGAKAVIHMGACSSTTETDAEYLMRNNYAYSRILCEYCLARGARFINASSAATYGEGERGFDDDPERLDELRPLNMYGYSKHLFDCHARRSGALLKIASLKFFNVFGPNEYHKGDMKSVACKAFAQIRETGSLRLFRSYRPEFSDGGQRRDFVYVKDVVEIMWRLLENPAANGLFNVGTGRAECFNDLGSAVFSALGAERLIEYIDMPVTLRDKYQYVTQADMGRLRAVLKGWRAMPLQEAVTDYVMNYLSRTDPYL